MKQELMKKIDNRAIFIFVKLLLMMIVPVTEWLGQKLGFTLFESWAIGAVSYIVMREVLEDLFTIIDLGNLKQYYNSLYESIINEEEES